MQRKLLIIVAVFIMMILPLSAGGSKETATENPITSRDAIVTLETGTVPAGLMGAIADVFDMITEFFCRAMSPFPNIMAELYSDTSAAGTSSSTGIPAFDKLESLSLSDVLLTSDGYYKMGQNTSGSGQGDDVTADMFSVSSKRQKSSWNMVTILFVSFLIAEIVYSAIYGYLTDRDGGVTKDIISKTVLCILLFLLAASLPFLIEAFRLGFFSIAKTLTGIDDRLSNESILKKGSVMYNLYSALADGDVYEYPGLLIRSLQSTLTIMNPSMIMGDEGVDIWRATDTSAIGKMLIELVYFVVKIIACFLGAFAAFHVMVNVCEVYLLLGIVIVLIPFTVFSPLRWMGQNAVRSLISNVLELFIILMIMFTSFVIAETLYRAITEIIMAQPVYMTIGITFKDPDGYKAVCGVQYPPLQSAPTDENGDLITDNIYTYTDNPYTPDIDESKPGNGVNKTLHTFYISVGYDSAVGKPADEVVDISSAGLSVSMINGDIGAYFVNALEEFYDESVSSSGSTSPFLVSMRERYKALYPNMPADELSRLLDALDFQDLVISDKLAVIKAFREASGYRFFDETVATQKGVDPYNGNNIFVVHIFSSLLLVFMQTYFVNQSSNILNAVLSGGVAPESFSNALMRGAAMKAGGAAAGIGGTAVKGFRGGVQHAAAYRAAHGGGWMSRVIGGRVAQPGNNPYMKQ